MASTQVKNLGRFFREVRVELAKMAWPSYREYVGSFLVAIFLMIAFAVYLGLVDFGLNWVMEQFIFNRFIN